MKTRPLISVMVPSYNHGQYLAQTLQSVLTQTYEDFELLILDDGSTDDSWEIIQAHARTDSRIRCWRQNNAGVVATLNRLMDKTRGVYVALLGSDDCWLPERLAWGVVDMAQDASLSATFCAFLICDGQLNPTKHSHPQGIPKGFRGKELIRTLIPHNNVGALTAFMRADAVRAAGPFARDFEACHDWELWLRLSLQGNLYLRPDIGALYRWHGHNMSATNEEVRDRETVRVLSEVSPIVARHYQLEDQVLYALALQTAQLALQVRMPRAAVDALVERSKQTPLDDVGNLLLLYALTTANDMQRAKELYQKVECSGLAWRPHLQGEYAKMAKMLSAV